MKRHYMHNMNTIQTKTTCILFQIQILHLTPFADCFVNKYDVHNLDLTRDGGSSAVFSCKSRVNKKSNYIADSLHLYCVCNLHIFRSIVFHLSAKTRR